MGPPSHKLPTPFPYFKGFLWEWYGSSMGMGVHYWESLEFPLTTGHTFCILVVKKPRLRHDSDCASIRCHWGPDHSMHPDQVENLASLMAPLTSEHFDLRVSKELPGETYSISNFWMQLLNHPKLKCWPSGFLLDEFRIPIVLSISTNIYLPTSESHFIYFMSIQGSVLSDWHSNSNKVCRST